MDPLSVAASVIAVVQLSAEIVRYISTAKAATTEWKRLSYEVLGCELVLQQIEEQANGGNREWEDRVKALEAVGGPLVRLQTTLTFVKEKIEPKTGLRKAVASLKWPFDSKEVDKIIAAIEREKALLSLALTNDSRRLIQEVKDTSEERAKQLLHLLNDLGASSSKTLDSIQDSQATLRAGIDELKRNNDDHERDLIIDWLSPSNYPKQHADLVKRREPGTGQWILDSPEYRAWWATRQSTLFCPGIPGVGKTILTSTVIDDLTTRFEDDSHVGIAHVYCNFRRQEEDADYLFLSLLKQLCQQLPYLPYLVCQAYRHHKPKQTQPDFQVIDSCLSSVMSQYSRVFILVDALDEADWHQRTGFLRRLFALQSEHGLNLFATSRFIPEIVKDFSTASSLEIRATDKDIERFLDGRMPKLPSFPDWSPRLQGEIKSKILEAVDGMFILAEIYLNSLDDKTTPRSVRKTLSQFSRQIPGQTEVQRREVLDKAYQQAMDRITSQKEGFRNLALKVLGWITCSARPLSPPELQHAIAVEVDADELDEDNVPRLERIVSICAGLVTVDEESRVIRLVHYTTQEFFHERWKEWFPNAPDEIATVCVTYLSFKGFRSGMCPTEEAYRERLRLYPLYNYAITYLGQHAHKASPKVKQKVIRFFDSGPNLEASIQAWWAGGPDHSTNVYKDISVKWIDGLYLATCLGLEDLIEPLLEKRRSRPKNPGSKADLENLAGVRLVGSTDASSLAPKMVGDISEDDIIGQFIQELDEQNQIESIRRAGYTLLHMATKKVREDVVKHLLDKCLEIEARGQDGYTPLHVAAEVHTPGKAIPGPAGRAGPEPLVQDFDELSRRAARHGSEGIASLLLERGARVDSRDAQGRTPLHVAAHAGNGAVVSLLLAKGADLEAKDDRDRTPLLLAVHRPVVYESPENLAVIELLLDKGADIEARFNDGWTPLITATRYDLCQVAKILLEKGADRSARDNEGRTPLSIATEVLSYDMTVILRSRSEELGAGTT